MHDMLKKPILVPEAAYALGHDIFSFWALVCFMQKELFLELYHFLLYSVVKDNIILMQSVMVIFMVE